MTPTLLIQILLGTLTLSLLWNLILIRRVWALQAKSRARETEVKILLAIPPDDRARVAGL